MKEIKKDELDKIKLIGKLLSCLLTVVFFISITSCKQEAPKELTGVFTFITGKVLINGEKAILGKTPFAF